MDFLLADPLRALGAATAACVGLRFLWSAYCLFLRPGANLKRLGGWAVVTGATDGIGEAYAVELAKKGFNIVLVSRTQSKLDATAEMLQELGVETRTVAADLSDFGAEAQARVQEAIEDLNVGVLINNAGMSYDFPQYFDELPASKVDALIGLNIHSATHMVRLVLPGMLEQRKGAIINISSASARFPSPLLSQYAASKSYIELFSASLNAEYASKGVHVQCQTPFFVTTKLAKIRHASLTTPTPKAFAKSAVKAIGTGSNVSPYWVHQLMLTVISKIPTVFFNKVVLGQHLGLRKRALKKLAAKAE